MNKNIIGEEIIEKIKTLNAELHLLQLNFVKDIKLDILHIIFAELLRIYAENIIVVGKKNINEDKVIRIQNLIRNSINIK